MNEQIESSLRILKEFTASENQGFPLEVDREQVVAHATLSALDHHWPSRSNPEIRKAISESARIKDIEHSRWAIQRRLMIAKFSKIF
jgi:hypothetical protein